ncbi:MAG TPA: ChaN family lipoprotein [Magnetospirillum sp.]|nr:ChaN family lipoprotein [Magnetospirillum sp.]
MRIAVLAAFLLALAAPALAEPPPAFVAPLERDHPLAGKVWLPAAGHFIPVKDLVTMARAADAVLLGETHDNPDHHALQAWMLHRLLEGGRRPLVAFEMMDTGQEPALRLYLDTNPGDAAGLGAALDWNKNGWPDWAMYRPIAEAALHAGAPLAPANLPRDSVRAIARGETPDTLPPLPDDQREVMEQEIRAGHCHMLPEAALPGMVRVQRQRDAVMAEALARGIRQQGHAVLIAGAGHVRADHGVPALLARQVPAPRVLALAFLEVKAGETDPAAYGDLFQSPRVPFDAVWFTPRGEREDQCAALKRHLEKKKGS